MVLTKKVIEKNILLPSGHHDKNTPPQLKLALIFLGIIIALTYTRIAWIGLGIFGFIIAAVFYRRLFIVFAVGIALFYILFYPLNNWLKAQYNFNLQSVGIIARLTTNNPEADSIKWRADVANKVIPLIEHRPLLGYGNGSFSKVWEYEKGVANIWDNTSEAHNDYLKVTFETGLVGIILFLSIFASLIYRQLKIAQKKSWTNIVFIASIAVYLVMSLSDNMLHHTPVIWWWWSIWGLWAGERL